MDLGIPELTEEQIETVSEVAEEAARKHIFSQVSSKQVERLDVSVEAEGTKPVNFAVEVDLLLADAAKDVDGEKLASEAVKAAFRAIELYLSKLK